MKPVRYRPGMTLENIFAQPLVFQLLQIRLTVTVGLIIKFGLVIVQSVLMKLPPSVLNNRTLMVIMFRSVVLLNFLLTSRPRLLVSGDS